MKRLIYFLPALLVSTGIFSSCMNDDNDLDTSWMNDNLAYYAKMQDTIADGSKYFTKYAPEWGPGYEILVHWHNDRSLTSNNLVPLDNSTVDIKYQVRLYDGTIVDSSYSNTLYGDSIYRSQPNQNIVGMNALLTTMHVGDSVTCVIPYYSGYGSVASGSVPAFSTLIFDVMLKQIVAWEKPI